MNLTAFFIALGVITLAAIVIMYAAESFEDSSRYLGRRMPAGIRGATINAIASSLPELLTTSFFLLLYLDKGGFAAGVATCAGSAVFNAVVIPAACMLAVSIKGVDLDGTGRQQLDSITINHSAILRDGFFFVLAEAALIYFLSDNTMTWWMGGALVGIYVFYFLYLMYQFKIGALEEEEEDDEDEEEEEPMGKLEALLKFDFNQLFFGTSEFTTATAWVNIILTTAVIAGACHFLAEYVMHAADALKVPPYFAAVILGAAATSVPDTFISVGDALEGDYDDAISNAIGSNIFDITLALGLPLLLFTLFIADGGTLSLVMERTDMSTTSTEVQELRIILLATTVIIMGIFLSSEKFGRKKAATFMGVYILWTVYVLGRAMEWPWLIALLE